MGPPLKQREAEREAITAPEGLAALSLDALTSVAYGPQAILVVLVTAGAAALPDVVPVTVAIVALLAVLVLSYIQVIDAYPGGGGAYAVSRENLGVRASLLAGASLIVDYTLTVAVSIAAGVAALTSAVPALAPFTVEIGLMMLAIIMVMNLRGVGESARAFLLPTFLFIVGLLAVIVAGWLRPSVPAAPIPPPAVPHVLEPIGALLLLRAFAAGCSALTGVEAIANGVPLFRAPSAVRAKWTEVMLGVILGIMLLGLAGLATRFHVAPQAAQTVLSQIMTAAVGRGPVYYVVALSITVVLGLAANTSFGGLPVLASLLASDNYLPHVFAVRGDRQVFQYGIWVLALGAAALIVAVGGNTDALIPMYAIGVFTGFTLSQSGMVVHWWRTRPRRWRLRTGFNALGAVATGVSTVVFVLSKFTSGAWVVVAVIPLLILLFTRVRRYYDFVREELALGELPGPLVPRSTLVIVPIRGLSRLTSLALSDAVSFGQNVVAVSVLFDDASVARLEADWERWQPGVRLVTLRSQYRSVVRPILRFVNSIEVSGHDRVMILIPEIVPAHWFQGFLHNQMSIILAAALRNRENVVVGMMPLHLRDERR